MLLRDWFFLSVCAKFLSLFKYLEVRKLLVIQTYISIEKAYGKIASVSRPYTENHLSTLVIFWSFDLDTKDKIAKLAEDDNSNPKYSVFYKS